MMMVRLRNISIMGDNTLLAGNLQSISQTFFAFALFCFYFQLLADTRLGFLFLPSFLKRIQKKKRKKKLTTNTDMPPILTQTNDIKFHVHRFYFPQQQKSIQRIVVYLLPTYFIGYHLFNALVPAHRNDNKKTTTANNGSHSFAAQSNSTRQERKQKTGSNIFKTMDGQFFICCFRFFFYFVSFDLLLAVGGWLHSNTGSRLHLGVPMCLLVKVALKIMPLKKFIFFQACPTVGLTLCSFISANIIFSTLKYLHIQQKVPV